MQPEEIKALRTALRWSPKKLAEAIGSDSTTVLAWERGEGFPTRKACEKMAALRAEAAPAVSGGEPGDLEALADPELWTLVRKWCRHPELRRKVAELAKGYVDPLDGA